MGLDSSTAGAGVEKVQSQAFVKGRIFYPAECRRINGHVTECAHPGQLSPDHLRGIWIKESQLELLEGLSFDSFAFVEKPYWLAPPERFDLSAAMVLDQLRLHFRRSRFPRLLVCACGSALSGGVETQHLFVMPDEWPVGGKA